MIEGESKRGWTTWTTAAVDKRVFAAVPMTMDLCNLNTVINKCILLYKKILFTKLFSFKESSQSL
jgi:PhoPQ-activated pathogenicity-related protein